MTSDKQMLNSPYPLKRGNPNFEKFRGAYLKKNWDGGNQKGEKIFKNKGEEHNFLS